MRGFCPVCEKRGQIVGTVRYTRTYRCGNKGACDAVEWEEDGKGEKKMSTATMGLFMRLANPQLAR